MSDTDAFLSRAVESGFLSKAEADELETLAFERGISPSRMALDTGRLNPQQVDDVEVLLKPRELIPGYEVLSLLGQGGMGVVYRARQLAFQRVVALKMVRTGAANPTVLARFEHEARTIGSFSHPHIVTAFDFGRHSGRLYLAMEFLDGEDGERFHQARGTLSESLVWGLMRQAASGLLYASERGVIHRDIKPANLLLVTPPRGYPLPEGVPLLKIADFGLALLQQECDETTRLTRENSTVGTPHYMAPEQLTGIEIDHRADLYALGATAYHLLSGKPPFAGLSLAQVYGAKLHGEPASLTSLREGLTPATLQLVDALMARDPAQRLADYGECISRIDAMIDAPRTSQTVVPAVAPPTRDAPLPTATRKLLPASWSRLGMGALVVMALLGGLIVALPRGGPATSAPAQLVEWQPSGWGLQCFDGRSLTGWQTVGGVWTPGIENSEGGLVLAGRGVIAHLLSKLGGTSAQPLAGFRVLTVVQLHTAAAIELQFPAKRADSVINHVLRFERDEVSWGTRQADSGPLDQVVKTLPVTTTDKTLHELRVEYQPGLWQASLDGQQFALETSDPELVLEFRLAAEADRTQPEAAAWFSDVILEELQAPQPQD